MMHVCERPVQQRLHRAERTSRRRRTQRLQERTWRSAAARHAGCDVLIVVHE